MQVLLLTALDCLQARINKCRPPELGNINMREPHQRLIQINLIQIQIWPKDFFRRVQDIHRTVAVSNAALDEFDESAVFTPFKHASAWK